MTKPQDQRPDDRRTQLKLAALIAVLTGAARAVTDWLIDHLPGSS